MQMPGAPHSSHQGRFYVVLITVVVGFIFFLLVSNSNFKGVGVTGSSVGLFDNSTAAKDVEEKDLFIQAEDAEELEKLRSREVQVSLVFDQVPQISREAKVQEMEVRFTNSGTKIKVNNDLLELNNLEEVTLKLQGFAGELNVDHGQLSLQGAAKRIEVNDIAFSSKQVLSLSISDVPYHYWYVDDVELKDLHVPSGNGNLKVAEKLQYILEQEEVNFYSFAGKITVDEAAENLLDMQGVAKGIDVSGALLNLDVR